MDELVEAKLKAMGYKEIPKGLANMLREFKKRQDLVRPGPLSLDAIISCSILYDIRKKDADKDKGGDGNKE